MQTLSQNAGSYMCQAAFTPLAGARLLSAAARAPLPGWPPWHAEPQPLLLSAPAQAPSPPAELRRGSARDIIPANNQGSACRVELRRVWAVEAIPASSQDAACGGELKRGSARDTTPARSQSSACRDELPHQPAPGSWLRLPTCSSSRVRSLVRRSCTDCCTVSEAMTSATRASTRSETMRSVSSTVRCSSSSCLRLQRLQVQT